MTEALAQFEIAGIATNRGFLIACLGDDSFAAGDVWTGFIDQRRDRLVAAVNA
jgi:pyruvate carboxylase